jgi:hypothetical protein
MHFKILSMKFLKNIAQITLKRHKHIMNNVSFELTKLIHL